MKVLVTGGAGYIGSHSALALQERGHEPVIVDSLIRGHRWAARDLPFYELDVRNEAAIVDVIKKESVEAVMHFAAFAYVGESMKEPMMYYDNNVVGSVRLLSAMKKCGVRKIVFSSTCATYGVPEKLPITEVSPQNPINPYGESKLMVEKILAACKDEFGLSSVALRYFNASGADPKLRLGEDHRPETHLIPLAVEAAFDSSKSLKVFGTDYPTPDGTCVRDYIHVTDLADAHVKALEKMNETSPGFTAYNLGTGRGVSVLEIIEGVERVTGRTIKRDFAERRPGDPPTLVADGRLAREKLDWDPRNSDLEPMLTTAVQWYEKHFLKGTPK